MAGSSRFKEFEAMDSGVLLGLWKIHDIEYFSEKDFANIRAILITRGVDDESLFNSESGSKDTSKKLTSKKPIKIFGISFGGKKKKKTIEENSSMDKNLA